MLIRTKGNEMQKQYQEETIRMVATYTSFSIAEEDIGDYVPSAEDIQKYYDEHPEEFAQAEQCVLRYIKVPLTPSDRDRDDINFTIGVIREQLESDDFEVLAKTYSEAQTSEVGGDTGFIARAQRDERVMTAVDGLQPGDLSEPVWTDDGVWVVKLIETEEEDGETRYRLNEIYLRLSAGSTTTDSLLTLAQTVQEATATEGGLESAAADPAARASRAQRARRPRSPK